MNGIRAMGAVLLLVTTVTPVAAGWDPAAFASQDVLEFHTVDADGDGHWSKVWLVVIEGDVYVRLGGPAARRIEGNTSAPVVKIRVAGQRFERVLAEPAPDMAEAVADAMGEKYWSDKLIRYLSHPLTLRLRAERQE